jgi:hypothetical protein
MCGLLIVAGCKSSTAKDAKMEPISLLEAGAEPRELLRYKLEGGTMTTSTMELSISSMASSTSAGAEIARPPGLRVVVTSGPAVELDNGLTRFDIRIVRAEAVMPPGVDREVERDLNRSAALLKDVGGWIEVDDRGIVREADFNQAAKDPNVPVRMLATIVNVRTSLARVILPAEPVGLGAEWEAKKELTLYGFEIEQVDRFTLAERVGDEVKIGVEIVQTAPKQTVTFEEEGVEFALDSLTMSAQGDVILNLNALEGSARAQGQSSEALTVKTVEGAEEIEVTSAFQLKMTVSYEASKKKATEVEDTATKVGTGQK